MNMIMILLIIFITFTATHAFRFTDFRIAHSRQIRNRFRLNNVVFQSFETLVGFGKPSKRLDATVLEAEETSKRYSEIIKNVNKLEDIYEALSNQELQAKTVMFRKRLSEGGSLESLLSDAFAVVREASWRVLELRHFDVQILAGVALVNRQLVEMATGEGKTLVALLPAYLFSLTGKSSLVVTSNDYLARRDGEIMGQVLKFLGVSVGIVQTEQNEQEKRASYNCDVTYVSNQALGFDYLRDNLAISKDSLLIDRPFGFCLVDEADSILIDEARTPLIISRKSPSASSKYFDSAKIAKNMAKNDHYEIDEKLQKVSITSAGFEFIEKLIGKSPFDISDPWAYYILNALRAKELLTRDRQYIVDQGEVSIIDDFSGRVLSGRKFTDGLQQAIEAKEGLVISPPTQCSAKVSYQSLFRLFPNLSGMTGTAATDAEEFKTVYNLTVSKIPTALPVARRDYPDAVFRTKTGKMKTLLKNIMTVHQKGRPILIGTTSIESSEEIYRALLDLDIDAKLLNARPENIEKENEIISQAGRVNAVTVATNLAGRGTDIMLGGNRKEFVKVLLKYLFLIQSGMEKDTLGIFHPIDELSIAEKMGLLSQQFGVHSPNFSNDIAESVIRAIMKYRGDQRLISKFSISSFVAEVVDGFSSDDDEEKEGSIESAVANLMYHYEDFFNSEKDKVIKLGGLYVVGTARHESRRIDNQLRGRAGRQGDPGASRFFLSLEDDLFRVFGGNKLTGLMENFKVPEEMPIESDLVTQALDKVQIQVENNLRAYREELFRVDDYVANQRNLIYAKRREILDDDNAAMEELFKEYCKTTMREIGDKILSSNGKPVSHSLILQFFPGIQFDQNILNGGNKHLDESVEKTILEKMHEISFKSSWEFPSFFRYMTLVQIDEAWSKYLTRLDMLKEELLLQAYGENRDPYAFFTEKASSLFENILGDVRRNTVYSIFVYKPRRDT